MPGPARKSCIRSELLNVQVGELELSHLLAFALVLIAIPLSGRLPPGCFLCSREERQIWRVPVTGHEGFEITAVPGFLLPMQNLLNRGRDIRLGILSESIK